MESSTSSLSHPHQRPWAARRGRHHRSHATPLATAGQNLARQILDALDTQTVLIPVTAAFGRVIVGVATQLREVRTERDNMATELETRLEAHRLAEVLTSMPGLGLRTALKILTIVGDGAVFPAAGHLAAYAGLAPVTGRSGTSIKGETRSQRGNHALKSALFLSASASLADPTSRAYYDRKRAQAKRNNAACSASPDAAPTSSTPSSATASPTSPPHRSSPTRIPPALDVRMTAGPAVGHGDAESSESGSGGDLHVGKPAWSGS